MKLPKSVPFPIFVLVVVVIALAVGSYQAGSSNAPSAQPVYITDGTGGNLANVVNVNHYGHLSIHIADSTLPSFTGELYARHMSYPARAGLTSGECYAGFVRGYGELIGAAVHFTGPAARRPDVLVRVDSNPIWVETKSGGSTPVGANAGFQKSNNTYVFGYSLPLQFKAFIGVMLCWHGAGTSDRFQVQMTAANDGAVNPYLPEEMTFKRTGSTFHWNKLQGPRPVGYQLMGTESTIVSYFKNFGTVVPSPIPHLHHLGHQVIFVPHLQHFKETVNPSKANFSRYYVFELQGGTATPTRVGPFGSFSGE
jgi:hypothetical protein